MTPLTRNGIALIALGVSLAGCVSSGQRYHDANMDFGAIRTVAVMPFANLSRDNLAGERVRDVFSSMLLASGGVYVIPTGEVARAVGKVGVVSAQFPTVDEVTRLGAALKADGIIVGILKEYGEVRSGSAAGNVISMSVQLFETSTGKVVWAGATTKGGVGFSERMFGGGGAPLNDVTEAAVDDLLNKLFK